jgi:hypothetical protein
MHLTVANPEETIHVPVPEPAAPVTISTTTATPSAEKSGLSVIVEADEEETEVRGSLVFTLINVDTLCAARLGHSYLLGPIVMAGTSRAQRGRDAGED